MNQMTYLFSKIGRFEKEKGILSEYSLMHTIINLLSEVAQLAEQRTVNPLVVGSSPTLGAFLSTKKKYT